MTSLDTTKQLKYLIVFNDHKYCLNVDNHLDGIPFECVLSEIQKQIDIKIISHETHTFEIFDNDFEEFVVITSDEQFVENLSRIRVLPKRKNKFSQTDKQYICENNCDSNESIVSNACKPINAFAIRPLSGVVPAVCPTSSSVNPSNTCLPQKINVTNIKNTVITNSTINGVNQSFQYSNSEKFRCQSLLAQFVHRYHQYFAENPNNQTNAWQMVSNEMISNGFKNYSAKLCKSEFNNLNSVYVQTLMNQKNYMNACTKFQLFAKLNSMDLKHFTNPVTYAKINELKKTKLKINKKETNSQLDCHKNPFELNNISVIDYNNKQTVNIKNIPKPIHTSDYSNDINIEKVITDLKQESIVDEIPEVEPKSVLNDSFLIETESEKDNISVKSKRSRSKSKKQILELPQTAIDSVLISCVKRHQGLLCDIKVNLDVLWFKVSEHMKEFRCPDKYCTPDSCKEQFNNLISQMVAVLQFADSKEEVRKMFTLFDDLSAINLKRLLSTKAYEQLVSLKKQKNTVPEVSEDLIENLFTDKSLLF